MPAGRFATMFRSCWMLWPFTLLHHFKRILLKVPTMGMMKLLLIRKDNGGSVISGNGHPYFSFNSTNFFSDSHLGPAGSVVSVASGAITPRRTWSADIWHCIFAASSSLYAKINKNVPTGGYSALFFSFSSHQFFSVYMPINSLSSLFFQKTKKNN